MSVFVEQPLARPVALLNTRRYSPTGKKPLSVLTPPLDKIHTIERPNFKLPLVLNLSWNLKSLWI